MQVIVRQEIVVREYLNYRHVLRLDHADALRLTSELFFMLPEKVADIVHSKQKQNHEQTTQ